jgi:hypothetical protein
MAFLGVTGYCRIWILGYADLPRPLNQTFKDVQKDLLPFVKWDDKSKYASHQLKKGPYDSSSLGSPRTSFNYMSMKREDWPWA